MTSRDYGYSARMGRLAPSQTTATFDRVAQLRAQGVEVLSLSVGEPDADPPPHVREAAKRAIDAGAVRYTEVAGLRSLRAAICADSARRRVATHTLDEVVVSAGAKHTLFNVAQVLFDHGDEVVIPTPAWGTYAEQARLCGAIPRFVACAPAGGFVPAAAELARAITPAVKAVVLCTPNNPTGAAYDERELAALGAVLARSQAWVIVDEIYAELTYDGFRQRSLLELVPELRSRLVIVDGVSKRYAMTGYRVGWMLGPAPLARACAALQSQATTSVSAVSQLAAQAALEGSQSSVETMRLELEKRRERLLSLLAPIDGFSCAPGRGAFYVFAEIGALLGRRGPDGRCIDDDVALVNYLLDEASVALVPGSAFGAPGYLRLSYAVAPETLERATGAIARAVSRLS